MTNCKSFLVTEAERKHVRRRVRFQQHGEASCHQVFFFFLKGKAPKEIYAILTGTLGGKCTIVCRRQKLGGHFKSGNFSTCDAPRPGQPKTVTSPEIIRQTHELILEEGQNSAKSIPEQLGNSRERVGSIIHEVLDLKKLSAKWVLICLNVDPKCQRCQSSEKFWNLFGAIQMIYCLSWWPWTKPGYIAINRRQSNNLWSGGITAHPAPKCFECKNPLDKFSPQFFGIKTASF